MTNCSCSARQDSTSPGAIAATARRSTRFTSTHRSFFRRRRMVPHSGKRPSATQRRRSVRVHPSAASSSLGVKPVVTGNSQIARSAAAGSRFSSSQSRSASICFGVISSELKESSVSSARKRAKSDLPECRQLSTVHSGEPVAGLTDSLEVPLVDVMVGSCRPCPHPMRERDAATARAPFRGTNRVQR
jgi:hypothetical protein